MAYSDYDLRAARDRLGLTLSEGDDLFAAVPGGLREFLNEWAPAALAMNTEKARSEFIIAPILTEALRLSGRRLNLFSGVVLDADRDRGLTGTCDYLLTRSPERFFVSHPVAAVVEAKREDIPAGLGQCVAAMAGPRAFNDLSGTAPGPVYGAVTTGNIWRFARLDGDVAHIDRPGYHLLQLGKILAILAGMAD